MITRFSRPLSSFLRSVPLALAIGAAACAGARSPESDRPERAEKWFQRAVAEYRQTSMDAARDSARQALEIVPADPEVRSLAARVALARLDYDEVLRLLKGVGGSSAASLRGRAQWYRGDIERAAEELDLLLADPDVEDAWAKSIAALAHGGVGRKPFETSVVEGSLVSIEMSRVAVGSTPLFVVPVEINGEPVLSLVATGTAEVMIDAGTSPKPSWISMRFGKRLEVRDVPALAQDLSGLSQQLGAPIKALLGANLLRHLNVTLDFRGRQFVARTFSPPAPPMASRLDVVYLRGGGMVVAGTLADREALSPLLVDTSLGFSLALDDAGWKRIGKEPASLERVASGNGPEVRRGIVPSLRLGGFTLPSVAAVAGTNFERLERELEVDLDGAVGSVLLAAFRMTLSDGGRVLWLEQPSPPPPPISLEYGPEPSPLDRGPSEPALTPGGPTR